MTDVAETPPSAPAPDEPSTLSPRDESRVALAVNFCNLADRALKSVSVDPDAAPGALLRAALDLQQQIDKLVTSAVVAERERGTTWDQIGAAASMTRQSAHEKWYKDVRAWAALGRTARPSKSSYATTLEYAAVVDQRYAIVHPSRPQAVTSGLDVVRFPGSQAYEDSLRARGSALHSQFRELSKAVTELDEERHALKGGGSANDSRLAENRLRHAVTYDKIADVYEQLVTAEPALADEHRAEAESHRATAQNDRKYAALLRQQG
ncbi:hypothetical protein [Streptomyces mordarskii]|uniref:Uncharacterized protein n=1 Tax=Streptomyces mordarskii TaxID=1226758 RepID=A0ABP3PS38_9ACTN